MNLSDCIQDQFIKYLKALAVIETVFNNTRFSPKEKFVTLFIRYIWMLNCTFVMVQVYM